MPLIREKSVEVKDRGDNRRRHEQKWSAGNDLYDESYNISGTPYPIMKAVMIAHKMLYVYPKIMCLGH